MQTQNVQFCLRFDEKVTEKAEHTTVCEHFEGAFFVKSEAKLDVPIHRLNSYNCCKFISLSLIAKAAGFFAGCCSRLIAHIAILSGHRENLGAKYKTGKKSMRR